MNFQDSNRKNKHLMNGIGLEEGSNLAASLMIGKRVLARRENDGFYYLGTVINMVCGKFFPVYNAFGICHLFSIFHHFWVSNMHFNLQIVMILNIKPTN